MRVGGGGLAGWVALGAWLFAFSCVSLPNRLGTCHIKVRLALLAPSLNSRLNCLEESQDFVVYLSLLIAGRVRSVSGGLGPESSSIPSTIWLYGGRTWGLVSTPC